MIAIVMEGGLVQCVVTNNPKLKGKFDIITIDYDTEGVDEEDIINVPQDDGSTSRAWACFEQLYDAGIDLKSVVRQLEEMGLGDE